MAILELVQKNIHQRDAIEFIRAIVSQIKKKLLIHKQGRHKGAHAKAMAMAMAMAIAKNLLTVGMYSQTVQKLTVLPENAIMDLLDNP